MKQVFPTPVGVFLPQCREIHRMAGLPHARGGVSDWLDWVIVGGESSPRPWGCFQTDTLQFREARVFPTPVGVFLIAKGFY